MKLFEMEGFLRGKCIPRDLKVNETNAEYLVRKFAEADAMCAALAAENAVMKAFGATHNAIFVAPTLYSHNFYADDSIVEIGRVENVMEEYHAIFAERMIQHPAVQRICNTDYSALFKSPQV